MKDGTCSKRFPKSFNSEMMVDEMGFLVYRRRPSANFVLRKKGTLRLDNQWVVPYNMKLLKKFEAHINVEWCKRHMSLNIFISMSPRVLILQKLCSSVLGRVEMRRLMTWKSIGRVDTYVTMTLIEGYTVLKYMVKCLQLKDFLPICLICTLCTFVQS